MLIKVYRKVVFIHDRFIFSSVFNSALIHDLLLYSLLIYSSRKSKGFQALNTLMKITRDRRLELLFSKGFFDRVKKSKSFNLEADTEKIVESIKIYPSIEYMVRAFPRNALIELIERKYIWFIPFNSIIKVRKTRSGGRDVLEIIYNCLLTNRKRVFRTIYSREIHELIKQLCMFNNNDKCTR